MEVFAKLKHLRIAPRKIRLIADLLRGKSAEEAGHILIYIVKRGKDPIKKLLESAIANAKNNLGLNEKTLVVSRIFVDEGPKLKRWMPRARGRAARIEKKISHITLVLEGEKKEKPAPAKKEYSKNTKEKKEKPAEKEVIVEKNKEPVKPVKTERKERRRLSPKKGIFKKVFRRKAF